jgi:tRNA(His) 5'-end guanylyltransferase
LSIVREKRKQEWEEEFWGMVGVEINDLYQEMGINQNMKDMN